MLDTRCTLGLYRPAAPRYSGPVMWAKPEYRNLLITERTLMARIQREGIEDKDLASCARVLVAVIDQKRVLRMKPKPKDIDVTKQPRRARVAQRNDPARPIFTLAPETEPSKPPEQQQTG